MKPAIGILAQRIATMARQSHGSHDLLVSHFIPRLYLDHLSGTAYGLIIAIGAYVMFAQKMAHRHMEQAAAFAAKQNPLLKSRAPVQVEPFEEIATVQVDGAFHLLNAGWTMTVLLYQLGERRKVGVVVTGRVELKVTIVYRYKCRSNLVIS
jgi:hypothetical protein